MQKDQLLLNMTMLLKILKMEKKLKECQETEENLKKLSLDPPPLTLDN